MERECYKMNLNNFIQRKLQAHIGHKIECVAYGNIDDPIDVCIECVDCNEVLISAEDFEEDD